MAIQAIITCDIVNSTKITVAKEKKLIATLHSIFQSHTIEFFRGDSFQAHVKNPAEALVLALQSRAAAIAMFKELKEPITDVRISIGLGAVKLPIKALNTAKGEAFLLSGRVFDEMVKSTQRLAITINNPLAQQGLQVICDFINTIFEKITGKQAEVILELLKGQSQLAIVKKTKKTKSTIHQLAAAGQWHSIEKLIQNYVNIITLIA